MSVIRLFDRRAWTKVVVMAVLSCGLFASVVRGQGAVPIGPPLSFTNPPSLVEKWLEPATLLTVAALLLYAGGLREDIKRLKKSSDEFNRFRLTIGERIDARIDDRVFRRRGGDSIDRVVFREDQESDE